MLACMKMQAARRTIGLADQAVMEAERLLEAHRPAEAAGLLAKACPRHPRDARLLTLNGRALLALGQPGPAVGALFLALELQPGNAAAHAALGSALHDVQDLPGAMEHSLAAYSIAPTAAHATTLSCVLVALGHYAEALAVAEHAVVLAPNSIEGLVNRAIALEGLGRFPEAVLAGRRAVLAAPGHAVAHHNLAVTLLGLGQLTTEAWSHYGWRLHLRGTPAWLGQAVRWTGQDVQGRTVLLHAEQGLGDTLQFVRYAPLVAARGARVVLAVQAPLLRLLRRVPGVDHVVAVGSVLPAFDVVCPLLDLPGLFGTTLADVLPVLPYADPFPAWDDGIAALRVGLVWAGSPGFVDDRQRSLPVAALAGLAGLDGVQFYNLQMGQAPPATLDAIDLMAGVHDVADTAARIAGLDLVVAVDTAVAHLAATMGKPVLLLSRHRGCWRWLHDRADSPWYPTLRVIRQAAHGNWDAVVAQVRHEIEALVPQPRSRPSIPLARPAAPGPRACKACGTMAPALGHVDFGRTCEDRRRPSAPHSGTVVTYHHCPSCKLLFTGDFDHWTPDDFRVRIYNDGYADADPDYAGERPRAVAPVVAALLGPGGRNTAVLDYGGGDGALAALLRGDHGIPAQHYDPFARDGGVLPQLRYPVVTCFEVLEHTPDPRATIHEIAGLVEPGGMVVMSTLLQPREAGLAWWYVAPRNGHLTLYSAEALRTLWKEAGFDLTHHGDNLHVARHQLG